MRRSGFHGRPDEESSGPRASSAESEQPDHHQRPPHAQTIPWEGRCRRRSTMPVGISSTVGRVGRHHGGQNRSLRVARGCRNPEVATSLITWSRSAARSRCRSGSPRAHIGHKRAGSASAAGTPIETQKPPSQRGFLVIGAPGFEPGTSPTRTVRATRLRHAPKEPSIPQRWQIPRGGARHARAAQPSSGRERSGRGVQQPAGAPGQHRVTPAGLAMG